VTFRFVTATPRIWNGRYLRIIGATSAAFHLRLHDGQWWPVIDWVTEEGIGSCWAEPEPAVQQLTDAVTRAKLFLGGFGGGSFLINEWGQVLVPASDQSGQIALAGRVVGLPLFEDPFEQGGRIDLSLDAGLQSGSRPPFPYVGCQYNLSSRHRIYCKGRFDEIEYCPHEDRRLIQDLRRLRPSGPVRFLVNPAGIVLTKHPVGDWAEDQQWECLYVGRIRSDAWFDRED
jgi:hypothetical protein